MQNDCTTIYLSARRAAGYTREKASEMIPCSVRSLANYESGASIPPNDIVERMVVVYNAQYLAYQHLHETNALAASIVPQLEQRNVMEIVVRLFNRMKKLDRKGSVERLMEIAEDGQIDQGERAEFEEIMADIQALIQTGLELRLAGKED